MNSQIDYGIAARSCYLWRNYIDIQVSKTSLDVITVFCSRRITGSLSTVELVSSSLSTGTHVEFQPYAGPGHWNDPDMVLAGVPLCQ